jgi:tRNA pseudouridine65 synthase
LPKREKAALVEVEIVHGRKHQIRRHFAMIRHPLLMDREYMDRKYYKYFQGLIKLRTYFLHAKKVSFKHFVTGKYIEIDTGFSRELKDTEAKII